MSLWKSFTVMNLGLIISLQDLSPPYVYVWTYVCGSVRSVVRSSIFYSNKTKRKKKQSGL